MDYNLDDLRNSFDNILKELDGICKSIDDLNDFEQSLNSKKPPIVNKKYDNYRDDYKRNNELSRSDTKRVQGEKVRETIEKFKNIELKSNVFRKTRLPDDKKTTPMLSNIIGSAQECTASLLLNEKFTSPMATKQKIFANQVSFSELNETINEKTEDSISSVVAYEDVDILSENERTRIKSFYNSMGCSVYVSYCTAELYQLKREDEFDSLESDPVKDYYIFMNRQKGRVEDDDDDSKSIVNFMYINSGVPVIIFNSGLANNKTRKKSLRIVLAERSTAFCMYEFKFDCLTEFENTDQTSVYRLSQTINSLQSHSASNMNLNYQNEFFEKFFNSKKRHAFKEHFLKFSIRQNYDEFYSNLKKILNDKKNSAYFHSNLVPVKFRNNSSNHLNEIFKDKNKQNSHYKSNQSLNSVTSIIDTYQNFFAKTINSIQSPSLILCHFSIESPVETRSKTGCLKKISSFASLNTEKIHKLEKQQSVTDVDSFNFDRNKYSLRRQITISSPSEASNNKDNKKSNLSKSVFNLDEFNVIDNGKNLFRNLLLKNKKLKKSDISDPVNFNHVSHLDKPVAIGKRYKVDY